VKIALIIEHFDPDGGGAERNVRELAEALASRGHEPTVLFGGGSHAPRLPGVEFRRSPSGKPRTAARLRAFIRWAEGQLQRNEFDASLSVTTAVPADVVQPLGGTYRETLIRNAASHDSGWRRAAASATSRASLKRRAALRAERRTVADPRIFRFAALSRYVADQLVRHHAVEPQRIVLIPNAVRSPTVAPDARERLREQLRIDAEQTMYLFSAFNPRLKGLGPLLDATRRLTEGSLVLTGRIRREHRRLIARYGLGPRVRIVGPTARMPDHYAAADVLVHPTFYDPFSRVVLESLLVGTPVVTTAFNGASDWLETPDGRRRGLRVDDPTDVDALAHAMAALAEPRQRDACREAARGLADELSLERQVDSLEDLLAQAAARR